MSLQKEVIEVIEAWKGDTDEFAFSIVFWREGKKFYRAEVPERIGKDDVDLDTMPKPLKPIDMTRFRGTWKPSLSEVSQSILDMAYIKSPKVIDYYGGDDKPGERLVLEAEKLEMIRNNGGHPNICEYYGCVRQDQFVTGLALKKYPKTLQALMKEEDMILDKRLKLYRRITNGAQFLHRLGLVHNDLNPNNIMVDENDQVAIIDFDSCTKIGDVRDLLMKSGTFSWSREFDPSAADTEDVFANDTYSLHLIHNYLFPDCPQLTPGVTDDHVSHDVCLLSSCLRPN